MFKKWLVGFGIRFMIEQLDLLEPLIAEKLKEGQSRANGIQADKFAKELVDTVQKWAYKRAGIEDGKL